ncbi:MAG: hypothetical protein WC227_01825 [Patescibacteria group bacterium]|jgi:hypothetical protein
MIAVSNLPSKLVEKLTTFDSEVMLTRWELRDIFPHRAHALVATRALISPWESRLILEPKDFGPFLTGHFPGQPVFPMHWMMEMSAEAAGLAALRVMLCEHPEKVADNRVVLQQSLGIWDRPPLMVNLNHPDGLIVLARYLDVNLEVNKNASYTAKTWLYNGKYHSSISEIKARLCSEKSLEKMVVRMSK